MTKKLFRAVAVMLCMAMLFNGANTVYATESEAKTEEQEEAEKKAEARAKAEAALQDAQKEKEQLDGALANAEALVKDLKKSKSSTQEKVNSYNQQLSKISAQISELESKLEELDTEITKATAELEEAEATADAQYEAMKLRIKYIYENKNQSYAQLLLSSRDMSSLLNAIEYITMMSDYDRDMLEKYKANKKACEETKALLEAEYETAKTMREEIGVQKQSVQVLKDAKTQELNEIGEDLADAEEVAKAYEAEVKAQQEVLAAIQATINAIDYGESYLSGSGFAWPCPSYTRVSSDYGPRTSPTNGASSNHKGVDLAAPYASAILAAESGVVTVATYSSSCGNYIIINHGTDSSGNVICTVYMHCSSLNVSVGDTVYRGQTIAAVGSTGISTGNHLHFAVTSNGSYVSPWGYISRP